MESVYTDPKSSAAAFSGLDNLYREARKQGLKISHKNVKKFAHSQRAYTRHFDTRKKFHRRRIVPTGVGTDYFMDLADMQSLKTRNRNVSYLLCVVDAFSRMAYVEPIKRKTPANVVEALKKIFTQTVAPYRLYSDRGLEFLGAPMKKFLEEIEVKQLTSKNDSVKASLAELLIRRLKTRLARWSTHTGKKYYLDILPHIVWGLNNSYNRILKMRPSEVTMDNEKEIWDRVYSKSLNVSLDFKFDFGDKVRVLLKKTSFQKGYLPKFSEEVYEVEKRIAGNPPLYKVRNEDGTGNLRRYYEAELVKVVKWKE